MYPWLKFERRIHLGIGAAMQTTERVHIAGLTTKPQNERVAATFLRYDTRNTNWYSEGINRGNLSTLLYESYSPFNSQYDGYITRFDTRGYLPLGDTVLSARWTEARAHGTTEAFQLGGSADINLTQAPMLNQRSLPLRGYQSGEAALTGQNVRIVNAEWRYPLNDIDSHAMVPPIGINRLSAAIFMDAGTVWDNESAKSKYYRSAGAELISELKVYYRVSLPVRLGIALGVDKPGGFSMYFMMGQMF
jgi:outer membrane protein assembly factor BamA